LNKTNATTIGDMYGGDVDQWPGKQITLYRGDTLYMGQPKKCVRVRPGQPVALQPTNGAKLSTDQQQILKNLYTNNNWPTAEVERLVKEVIGNGIDSLGQIGQEHFQTLAGHFGKDFKPKFDLTEDDIPF